MENSYYGSSEIQTLSYLEFGSIDLANSKKEIWGYCQHQQAYDYYMFARYANDLFLFREYINETNENRTIQVLNQYILKSAHTKLMDYIFKYAGILTVLDETKGGVCESGSSLFGLIDEAIALDYAYNKGENHNKIKRMKYIGSDISEMMHKGAEAFHLETDFCFSTADTMNKFLDELSKRNCVISLFYGLSVSLRYALRSAEDLLKIGQQSELAIFNRISLSRGNTIKSTVGTGKYVYIISLDEYINLLNKNNIVAKYCTANMQYERDGKGTIRASIVMSKNREKMEEFIMNYNKCIEDSLQIKGVEMGEWKDINELLNRDGAVE